MYNILIIIVVVNTTTTILIIIIIIISLVSLCFNFLDNHFMKQNF